MDTQNRILNMKKIFNIAILVLIINYSNVLSQSERPKAIINIVVDNLSNSEIDRNSLLLSDEGLIMLRDKGFSYTNASYPYISKSTACDYSTISTGTTPRYHGIISSQWYSPKAEINISCIENKNIVLIDNNKNKKKGYDASKLMASTIGDELKVYTQGESKIYSVSLNNIAAVLLGGHAADGAFWFDASSGNWVTSDYYMSWLPEWVSNFNNRNKSFLYLSEDWKLTYNDYNYNIDKETYDKKNFPITLKDYQDKKTPYNIISSTPMGCMLLVDFTQKLIINERIGKDNIPDILNINFSTITDSRLDKGTYSIAKADFIIRLDKEIARLIKLLNEEIGTNNYIITLTGTHPQGQYVSDLKKYKIPTGIFDPWRAKALLNSYLMAKYGQGSWILNFSNQQIFLNKDLINKKQLSYNDFQNDVASFISDFEGIKLAIPISDINNTNNLSDTEIQYIKESIYPKRSGDIFICYQRGWAESSLYSTSTPTYNEKTTPLYIYGKNITNKTINTKVFLTGLAPTLSEILGIPIPNNSSKDDIYYDIIK